MEGDFTEMQADQFIERFEFQHQLPNQFSGFSAALFWGKIENKHVLAIRGSELDITGIPTDVLMADIWSVGDAGFANKQVA